MHDYTGMGWGMGWIWIIGVIGIIIFIVFALRPNWKKNKSAIEMLDERYARGEISEEEYTTIKKNLN